MNTSIKSTSSVTMPMPSTSTPIPSSPLLPSDIPSNQFTQFFKAEDASTSLPYPTTRQHCFYLKIDIKREWNAEIGIKDSQKFRELAVEIENELKTLLTVNEGLRIYLVHVQKDRWSHKRILLTFVMQTIVNFSSEKFESLLREHIKQQEKLLTMRTYARDLKVRKIPNAEYEHLIIYGCNPCAVCDQVLKKHRKVNVNHPSVKMDILIFLVVMLSLGLALTVILLIVLK